MTPRFPLPKNFSVYLDALRLCAALYVFLFHLMKHQIGAPELLRWIPDRGHDAVIVFFVLSGYVIAAATDRKSHEGLRGYVLDRAARVYSVAVPTLVFSLLVALFIEGLVRPNGVVQLGAWLSDSLVNFFFLGQSWSWKKWVPYNQPYWSLCYEVMYYVGFGLFFFWRGWQRFLALLMVVALAGPKVLLLMPCWIVGVLIYRMRDQVVLSPRLAWFVAFIVPGLLAIGLNRIHFGAAARELFDALYGNQKSYLEFSYEFYIDYVTAVLVAINIYASRYIDFRFPAWLSKLFVQGASMSFTLYLMHLPMVFTIQNLLYDDRRTVFWFGFSVLAIPMCCYLISEFTEHKRAALRNWLDARIPQFH